MIELCLVLQLQLSSSLPVKLLGRFVNDFMVGSTGVATTYLLSLTGRDYAALKGSAMAVSQWMFLTALSQALGVTAKSKKPWGEVLFLIDHIIYGALIAVLVSKFGDESLFPDGKGNEQPKNHKNKPPVISYKGIFA